MPERQGAERLQAELRDVPAEEVGIGRRVVDDDGRALLDGEAGQPLARREAVSHPQRLGADAALALQRERALVGRQPDLGRLGRSHAEDRVERLVEHLRELDGRGCRLPDGEDGRELTVALEDPLLDPADGAEDREGEDRGARRRGCR